MTFKKVIYIKQIDGLRGISILSVILYHFFPEIFVGGFIGVDIFCNFWFCYIKNIN